MRPGRPLRILPSITPVRPHLEVFMRLLTAPAALLALVLMLLAPFAAHAVDVTAEGTAAIINGNIASAKNQALLNAQREAVEQGVGLVLDSKTRSENFQVI